jgi:AbiV family abortive infection protein
MQELAIQNALRLHFDSIALYNQRSLPSALTLSILALEEIGKSSQIHRFIGDIEMWPKEQVEEFVDKDAFLDSLYKHPIKQKAFVQDLLFVFPKNFLRKLENKKLDTLKQNSMYVGFQWKKGKPDFSGRLRSPLSVRDSNPRSFITVVNDYLIVLTHSIIKGVQAWDTPNKKNIFNDQLLERLKSSWKNRGRLSRTRLKWLDDFAMQNKSALFV